MVASKTVTTREIETYLKTIHTDFRCALVNSAGGKTGMSALHRAAELLDKDKIIVLLKYGASLAQVTQSGKNAYVIASEKGADQELLAMLEVKTAPVCVHVAG